jgi:hypothetical protein
MPFPIYDVVPCMKTSSERTDAVMRRIQDLLHRNVSPKKYSNGQAFRLQQVRLATLAEGFNFIPQSLQILLQKNLVQQSTIPTKRPPLVGEVSANFCI